jgi:hypothetical protein
VLSTWVILNTGKISCTTFPIYKYLFCILFRLEEEENEVSNLSIEDLKNAPKETSYWMLN